MSRAERIEAAARALLAASSRIEAETMCVVPRRLVDALRSALAAQPAQAGEAVAREAAEAAYDEAAQVDPTPRRVAVDRAVAHALRAQRPGGAS